MILIMLIVVIVVIVSVTVVHPELLGLYIWVAVGVLLDLVHPVLAEVWVGCTIVLVCISLCVHWSMKKTEDKLRSTRTKT